MTIRTQGCLIIENGIKVAINIICEGSDFVFQKIYFDTADIKILGRYAFSEFLGPSPYARRQGDEKVFKELF